MRWDRHETAAEFGAGAGARAEVRAEACAGGGFANFLALASLVLMTGLVLPVETIAETHGQGSASGPVDGAAGSSDGGALGVDESTGAATLSIPIDLPPGPNDLVPSLALSYSSLRGNGPLGVGWDVELPRVRCSTRFGLPRDGYDACEAFELGGELLVGPDSSHSPPRWHTLTEAFDRITQPTADEWRVTSTEGTTMIFGGALSNRVTTPGDTPGTFDTLEWLLASIEDTYGNAIHFSWENGAPGDEGDPRIASIDYAGETRLVEFVYEPRPDPIRTWEGGIRRVAQERLREVRVSVNGALHHRVVLTYDTPSLTNLSRLRRVQRFGSDCDPSSVPNPVEGGVCSALPATTFDYSDTGLADATLKWTATGAPGPAPTGSIPDPSTPVPPWYAPADSTFSSAEAYLRGTTARMADIDGDGLVDIVADWPGRRFNDDTLMPWIVNYFYSGDASDPIVMLNNGIDGWDLPSGSNGSQIWTDRIRALAFDVPSITVKQVVSIDPADHPPHDAQGTINDDRARTKAFGTCVDPGDDLPEVEWKPIGDVQFAGVEPWSAAPHFDASAFRNHTPELCIDDAFPWNCVPLGSPEDTPVETEIRAWPTFQFADLNGDQRADLVMSVHLSGFHLSFDDCVSKTIPPRGQETWVDGASAKVVFMNNGSGWDRDDGRDPSDGLIAESLPPFGIVAFESSDLTFLRLDGTVDTNGDGQPDVDPTNPLQWSLRNHYYSSPCDDYGLAGVRGVDSGWFHNTSWDFCVSTYDLTPVFTDLNGDGLVDLVVSETADPDALFHDFDGLFLAHPDGSTTKLPNGWRDSAGVTSVAYLQNPDAGPGEPHWLRSEAWDLPFRHAGVRQIEGESPYVRINWRQRDSAGNAQSYNVDQGVRFVDLNRDGLTDVVKAPYYRVDHSVVDGAVLMNTGARSGDPAHTAWCVSRALGNVPVCPEAAAYELPVPVRTVADLIFGGGGTATMALGSNRIDSVAAVYQFDDLNGDGWVDFIQSDPQGLLQTITSTPPQVFLQNPGASPSVWQEAPGFLPAGLHAIRIDYKGPDSRGEGIDGEELFGPSGYALTDVNGDGVMDFVASDRLLMTHKSSWVSTAASARSDLLVRYENGRGLSIDLTYASTLQQRDASLEAKAEAHAVAPLLDADPYNDALAEPIGPDPTWPSVDDLALWTAAPVLASRTIATPVSSPATTMYRYAQPRRCHDHRADLGFRHVEVTRPDQSRVDSFFYQKHGRTGRLAERTIFDESGRPVHFASHEWELANPTLVGGGFVGAGGLLDIAYIGRLTRTERRNEYGSFVGERPGVSFAERFVYDDVHGYNFVTERWNETPGRGTRTVSTPAPVDETYYLPRRTARTEVFADQGADQRLLSRSDFVYYDQSATPDPRKIGLRVDRIQSRDDPTTSDARWTFYAYSDQGNLIEERVQLEPTISADGVTTTYCYDGDPGCPVGQNSHSLLMGTQDALGNWRHQEVHPVFGRTTRSLSDYRDEPTTRIDYDSFGRTLTTWHEPTGAVADVLLTETDYFDFPTAGFDYAGGFQPFVVTRRFAEAGAASAREKIVVDGGGATPLLEVDLLVDGGGVATAVGREIGDDPVARLRYASEPFACGSVTLGLASAYALVLDGCEAAPATSKTWVTTESDALGRPVRVDTPLGFELFAYGAEAITVVGEGAAMPHDVVFHKDAGGGLQEQVRVGGQAVRVRDCDDGARDPDLASLVGVACGTPIESRFVYEPTGELRSRIDATVAPGAWLAGMEGLSPAQHLTHRLDTLGRIIEIQDPDAGTTRLEHDVLGRLVSTRDARGLEVRNDYDALGRLTRIESDDPNESPTSIDYATRVFRKVRVRDGARWDFEKSYVYDAFGRTKRVVRYVDGHQLLMDFEYDLLDRRVSVAYPTVEDGAIDRVAYDYDGSFLSRVCDVGVESMDCDGAEATPLVSGVDFDELGRVSELVMPGGTRTFTYDGNSGRRRSDVLASSTGDDLAYHFERPASGGGVEAAYDERGNLTHVAATLGSGASTVSFTHAYEYDGRNRISGWAWNGEVVPREYDYDLRGNLVSHEGEPQGFVVPSAELVDPIERAHAIRARLDSQGVGWAYRYDEAGNLVERTSSAGEHRRFRFDARGRLDCVGTPASECQHLRVGYRGDGERAKEVGSRTYYYAGSDFRMATLGGALDEYWIEIHALGQRIAYKHVNGGALRRVEVAPGWQPPRWWAPAVEALGVCVLAVAILVLFVLVAAAPDAPRAVMGLAVVSLMMVLPVQVRAGGWIVNPHGAGVVNFRFVVSDMIGSGQAEFDGAGNRVRYDTYSPYGRVADSGSTSGGGGRRYYAGHDRQLDVGLVYMNSRWMDPQTGGFVSVDPVVREATTTQSWNGYGYVEGNPISGVDPTGAAVEWRIVWTNPETGHSFATGWKTANGIDEITGGATGANLTIDGVDAGFVSFTSPAASTSASGRRSAGSGDGPTRALVNSKSASKAATGLEVAGRGNMGRAHRPNPRLRGSRFTPRPPKQYAGIGGSAPTTPGNARQALIDGVSSVAEQIAQSGYLGSGATATTFADRATVAGEQAIAGQFGENGVWVFGDVLVGSAGELGAAFLPRTVKIIVVPDDGSGRVPTSIGPGVELGPIYIPPVRDLAPVPMVAPSRE